MSRRGALLGRAAGRDRGADRRSDTYEVGIAHYRELARGQILGDSFGMLKLLVDTETRKLLGAHVFGTGAGVDYLVDTVFNYPTLAEGYKVAALDATNKIRALSRITDAVGPARRRKAA